MPKILSLILTFLSFQTLLAQSVLSSGEWHQVSINETSIYKIDRNFLSNNLKINLSSFDPRTFKVYGTTVNGMLPQQNSTARPNDPQQLAILGVGTSDGSMDAGDYFLFAGFSPDHFSVDSTHHYQKHLYADHSSYFLTYGGQSGKRIQSVSNDITGTVKTTFTDYIIHESDLVNKFKSGRLWLGEDISNLAGSQKTFSYDIPGATGPVEVTIGAAAGTIYPSNFELSMNGDAIGVLPIDSILSGVGNTYQEKAKYASSSFSHNIQSDELDLKIDFNQTGNGFGSLDYFIIAYERSLAMLSEELILHTGPIDEPTTYLIANSSEETLIWDVTDRTNTVSLNYSLTEDEAHVNLTISEPKSLITFNQSQASPPTYIGSISNQNIKSLIASEGIIITHPDFEGEAQRLANFHIQQDHLSVGVVTTQEIYNEFSSGIQDITAIRDFLKYLYDQGGTLKYALLFGDGSYDYKDRVNNNTNFVPVYESRESFHPIFSHSSDDFFGFFEEDEGYWFEGIRAKNKTSYDSIYVDHTLEIGIGRIPVKSKKEASGVVDKIIRYKTSSKTLGKWRNNITYLSDDGDNGIHMDHADKLFDLVDSSVIEYNAKKVFLDNFEQENNKSPQATQAILDALKDGAFVFNYMGHGNETQLTIENIFNTTDIGGLTNRQKLPLFIIATCDFGKYDDPSETSGSELLMLSENGGGIGVITTTRPVYAHTNFSVNQSFHESIFNPLENGDLPRLGDVIKATKNNSLRGPVNRNFALLGDPMLVLNYPKYDITFDQMDQEMDTLSALEKFTLSGSIQSSGSDVSFDGKAVVTVWDIPQEKVSRGISHRYSEQSNAIFRGEVSVENGQYSLEFVLPKNTSYSYRPGKITMYAWDEKGLVDASGATKNFVLGGTESSADADNEPPTGKAYLNEPSFRSGQTVGTNSLLIVELSDESGINISNNGFNNNITLTINDGSPIILNEFYTATQDDFTKGNVVFPIQDLEPGSYHGVVKFWDAHNNSGTTEVEFRVSDEPKIRIYNDKIYPNPVISGSETTFSFSHDREGEELEMEISIYNMHGDIVYQRNDVIDNSPGTIDDLKWSVGSNYGAQLIKGVYIYRLSISSTLDGANNELIKRLIIQ